jgi:hypothetical protein
VFELVAQTIGRTYPSQSQRLLSLSENLIAAGVTWKTPRTRSHGTGTEPSPECFEKVRVVLEAFLVPLFLPSVQLELSYRFLGNS